MACCRIERLCAELASTMRARHAILGHVKPRLARAHFVVDGPGTPKTTRGIGYASRYECGRGGVESDDMMDRVQGNGVRAHRARVAGVPSLLRLAPPAPTRHTCKLERHEFDKLEFRATRKIANLSYAKSGIIRRIFAQRGHAMFRGRIVHAAIARACDATRAPCLGGDGAWRAAFALRCPKRVGKGTCVTSSALSVCKREKPRRAQAHLPISCVLWAPHTPSVGKRVPGQVTCDCVLVFVQNYQGSGFS